MTVSTEINHEEYVGNGVTYVFPYRFRILKASNMVVVSIAPNGTETTLILNTGFTVTGVGSYAGGNVTLPNPLPEGWGLTLTRDLPAIQETDLRNQGTFFAETHEDAFDYLTMLIQQGQRAAEIINLRALRVPESSVALVPRKSQRANKILAFNGNGDPMVVLPPNGSASDVMIELAKPTGAGLIGVQPQGNLQQLFFHVTPEQYGAIGDGTVHPLSERYATLAAAQAVYPHVTSLTQTIDWAACQSADKYARLYAVVKSPRTAIYHLGSNYLELSIKSKWDSGFATSNNAGDCPRFTRNIESTLPAFGQYCIVRVQNAGAAGSADEFVRGIMFKGYCLTYGLPNRSASKSSQRICLHMNYGHGAELDVAVRGGEYGVFGYSFWGSKGQLVIDSCHKAFYADPKTITPENLSPPSNTNTSFDFYVKIDACPFGLVLRACHYSIFNGFIEGAVIGFANYDSTNETAIAITAIDSTGIGGNIGIEAWQGAHIYNSQSTTDLSISLAQSHNISNTTGKDGPWYSMSLLNGAAQLFTLPAGNNALYYSVNRGRSTIRNVDGDFSGAPFDAAYLCYQDVNSKTLFANTRMYTGSIRNLSPANWANVDVINDFYLESLFIPGGGTGHKYSGKGVCVAYDYSLSAIAADGTVTITPPVGWRILSAEAHVNVSTSGQASSAAVGIKTKAVDGSSITFQTGISATGYSILYRLTLLITK